ncbi:hsp70-binding protein 1 isoform X2 [Plutella xylostella]|nr:hsp70-binding protein 1 isoform X2 [Plutella xylostella]XP_048482178.1 hsp70-binding protein 1 isoform X2 [Plutella xylostella]
MGSNQQDNQNQMAGSLTFPGSSNVQAVSEQPRQPRNLQGLLRFAMEATKIEDAPGESQIGPMDEERRKFLEEALKNLTVNVSEVLREAIKVLANTEVMHAIQLGQALPEEVQTAFDNLLDFTDNIDMAVDFYKMGGFSIFPVCYGSENEKVRARASSVLGELCQNNPFCQSRALEFGLLNVLLSLVETEQGTALAKSLYALSCATREYEPACRELIAQGGCGTLVRLFRAGDEQARTKAAFLTRYLATHYPEAKAQFINQNVVKTITEQLKAGRDNTTEHYLSVLVSLVDGEDATVLRQCRDSNLGQALRELLKLPELQDQFIEEKDYCEELLKVIGNQSSDGSNPDGADR